MSLRRIRRPFEAKLIARMSCSDPNAPETRSDEPLVAGLQDAGRTDGVLRLQRGDEVAAIDAQPGQLLGGELDDDLLVLGAEDLDLRHIGARAAAARGSSST